ncbi:MAG: hypothetical protein SGCHY_005399 [Lobulomycetales sp.]
MLLRRFARQVQGQVQGQRRGFAATATIKDTVVNQRPKNYWLSKFVGATFWFFLMYRMKEDGPHHFGHHVCFFPVLVITPSQHPWDEPEVVEYLERVDKRFPGSRLSIDNIHMH